MQSRKYSKASPYLMLSPLLILLGVVVVMPAAISFVQSLYNIDPTKAADADFVGAKNYLKLMSDKNVIISAKNTILYVGVCIICETVFGLIFSSGLKMKSRFRGVVIAVMIIPWALPPIVNGIMWKWIYDPSYGLLNDVLLRLGIIEKYNVWFSDSRTAILLTAFVHIWKMIPIVTLVFLAQMQSIPKELYESAMTDGATRVQRFIHITMPLIKPAFFIVFTQGIIASVQLFDEVYALNGMAIDTRTVIMQNYFIAFRNMNISYGMALAVAVTALTVTVTGIFLRSKKESGSYGKA